MKIIDTITFYKENMMTNLRLNILNDYVDYFVICEAKYSHSGNKKKLFFDYKKFKNFKKKIIYFVVENEPSNFLAEENDNIAVKRQNSILRINFQRDQIKKTLSNFSQNDFMLYSDNDEIPNLSNLNLNNLKDKFVIFKQKLFYYKFNLYLPKIDWYGTKGCKIKHLKSVSWLRNIKNKRYNYFRLDTLFSDTKYKDVHIVNDGGWHFSNLKDLSGLRDKYLNDENYSEFAKQMTLKKIKSDMINRVIDYDHNADKKVNKSKKVKLKKVNLKILPKYLLNNKKYYRDWID